MSLFNKEGDDQKKSIHENFQEGDIFYTAIDQKYHLFQLLRIEEASNTFHVKVFEATTTLPTVDQLEQLTVQIYHVPIAADGFKEPNLLLNKAVNDNDLSGYFEYIKQTQHTEEIIKYAKSFYKQGYDLTTQQKHLEAVKKYDKAIDLIPGFFEAIDNRAFCFMDLGQWKEAIEGFHQSLEVNPNSFLAIFSIGECHLKLKEYPKAVEYFEKATVINPNYPKTKEFLEIAKAFIVE